MSDVVERLRGRDRLLTNVFGPVPDGQWSLHTEAADEITSLRTLLAEMRGAVALAIVHDEYGADEWRGIKARLEAALGDQP